jgi:hypothetical protein
VQRLGGAEPGERGTDDDDLAAATLDSHRARIASCACQDEVLDLRSPEAFDSDRLAAAPNEAFRDGDYQRLTIKSFSD